MASADVVKLLGPGSGLDSSLTKFVDNYGPVVTSFDKLLRFPFLEDLKVTSDDNEDPTGPNFREIIQDGKLKFDFFAGQEVALARNLTSFGSMIPLILKSKPPSQYAIAVRGLVQKFAKEAEEAKLTKEESLKKLDKFLSDVEILITSATSQIKDLTDQITAQQELLKHADVVETLKKALSALFKLATSDKDAKTQLSVILGLASEVISGSFDSLFKDAARLHSLIAALERLRDTLVNVKAQLGALSSSLRNTMAVTDVLNDVWINIGKNLDQVSDYDEVLTTQQLAEVERAWKSTITVANDLVAAISGASRIKPPLTSLTAQPKSAFESTLSLPKTPAELAVFQAIEEGGKSELFLSQSKFQKYRKIIQEDSVRERVVENALRLTAKVKSDDPMKEFMENFQPPADVQESLDKLAGDCKGVMKQFDDILQLPYLDSLSVINPLKGQSEDPTNGQEKIDIRSMVDYYYKLYRDLQVESVDAIRKLIVYSEMQLTLLPLIKQDGHGTMTLSRYTEINQKLVQQHKAGCEKLYEKYVRFGNTWHDAQNNLLQAIATAKKDVENLKTQIEEQQEAIKHQTLMGWLEIVGGVIFTAAAFVTGGLLFAAVGIGLLAKGIMDLVQAGQLGSALQGVKTTLETTETTQKNLESLVEPMDAIAKSITKIALIFDSIAQSLGSIDASMTVWGMPGMADMFETLRPSVCEAWDNIKLKCNEYIAVISGDRF